MRFFGDWAGPWSAAQLSAHDLFQGLQVDLSNNHPAPCECGIVARRRHAQRRTCLQRIARKPCRRAQRVRGVPKQPCNRILVFSGQARRFWGDKKAGWEVKKAGWGGQNQRVGGQQNRVGG